MEARPQRVEEGWPGIQKLIKENNKPGEFVTFLGYEWSSGRWGDRIVYYFNDDEPIRFANTSAELYSSLQGVKAMVIPHHTAYPVHHRGLDWDTFYSSQAPVVEMFSGHGSSETDDGPFDFTGNPMGPRARAGTAQRGLELGHIFGFIGSSDEHAGFAGFYGHGLAAVHAEELTREAIWDAFWKRRTYAVTGDRILLDFQLNGNPMGSVLKAGPKQPRQMAIAVDGWDSLDRVEILKNCQVVKRWSDFDTRPIAGAQHFKVWTHWGYHWQGAKDWKISVEVDDGSITGYNPCFQPPGYGYPRLTGTKRLEIASRTDPRGKVVFQKLCLGIEGRPETRLTILDEGKAVLTGTVGELLGDTTAAMPFGDFNGGYSLGRAVAAPHYSAQLQWEDPVKEGARDYYYVRVFQKNGQMAWSSPIWVMQP